MLPVTKGSTLNHGLFQCVCVCVCVEGGDTIKVYIVFGIINFCISESSDSHPQCSQSSVSTLQFWLGTYLHFVLSQQCIVEC